MTPNAILAAVDFSGPSRTALQFAGRLAVQCGAALHVLYSEHTMLAEAARERGLDLTGEARDELRRFTTSALGPQGDLDPQIHLATGPAAAAIEAGARRHGADLIVVGSHGMSPAARLVFGSTTQRTLRRSSVSVLVVPDSWVPPAPGEPGLSGMGPLVTAVDFSDASIAAASAACGLATRLGTEVELVHAVPPLSVPGRWQAQADAVVLNRVAQARRELDALAQRLPSPVVIRLKATDGPVPEVLAEAATAGGGRHPILVLGRATRDGGTAPGAIAYQTLSRAQVPVLMHAAQADAAK